MKSIAGKVLLLLASTLAVLLLAELTLRLVVPRSGLGAGWELRWMRNNPEVAQWFIVDPDFGFRPKLGTERYSEYGVHPNQWSLKKEPGRERLLFVGDSVTARGTIVRALKHQYGDEDFEYWNAGVESFNTVQEVEFYKRYNSAVRPDHVILTFHTNDFETTPVAFYDSDRLVVYAPHSTMRFDPWLYQNVHLYRLMLGAVVTASVGIRERIELTPELEQEVAGSLRDLKQTLAAENIRLTVLVLPYLAPYEKWPEKYVEAREGAIRILRDLNIRYFDLLDPAQRAIARGITAQAKPGDFWHPSQEISDEFAAHLHQSDIF